MSETVSGIPINDYRQVKRGDYGVRVARKGFDASTSADSELLFNSGWRIVQIVKVISEEHKKLYLDQTSDIPPSYYHIRDDIQGNYIWTHAVDEQYLYLPKTVMVYVNPQDGVYHYYYKQYRIYHGLGYVPMFFKSEYVSDKPGYYLMTNVDIRQDADYPYSSQPSYYSGISQDYGMKSKAWNNDKLPRYRETRGCGLNTNIQAKMVMATKTEQTKSSDPSAAIVAWGLPKDNNTQTVNNITDFECFCYWKSAPSLDGTPDDTGGTYMEMPVGILPANDPKGARYQIISQSNVPDTSGSKAGMVILRSPMVAPDIEEVVIS